MSELQALCNTLSAIDQDIMGAAQQLQQHAQRCAKAAQYAASTVRNEDGTTNPGATHAANALNVAARAAGQAAQLLAQAAQQGQAFVARTVANGSGGGAGGAGSSGSVGDSAGGLQQADIAAIQDYTGTGYLKMNAMLRGEIPLDASIAERVVAMSSALKKLPDYQGLVVRGTNLSEDVLSKYVPGNDVCEHAFTSYDKLKGFSGNVQFHVESKTGKDISGYSIWGPADGGHEREVLFDRSTKFRVTFHGILEDGTHNIYLEEV
ncbi:MAG: hypothetical protein EOT05_02080 [Candidatus Microsaccharimonas sossegonensis]|uniref:ADP ribosyltransferase domain-containing protein n=1 Tax=Candidatus Microsaccharimonas sossegonensis TaxID=2506948 RepID=A0A4Q0AHS0_9BACT|nr:ADP-ribosyltransferase [Microbacterium sp. MRS-1]RWZ78519.1 MAG: hypothetical protein EOT05_02080 [Candidatus Microsaccharimonas sossegonensis]